MRQKNDPPVRRGSLIIYDPQRNREVTSFAAQDISLAMACHKWRSLFC